MQNLCRVKKLQIWPKYFMVSLVEDFSIHLRLRQLMDVEVELPGAPNCKITRLIHYTQHPLKRFLGAGPGTVLSALKLSEGSFTGDTNQIIMNSNYSHQDLSPNFEGTLYFGWCGARNKHKPRKWGQILKPTKKVVHCRVTMNRFHVLCFPPKLDLWTIWYLLIFK